MRWNALSDAIGEVRDDYVQDAHAVGEQKKTVPIRDGSTRRTTGFVRRPLWTRAVLAAALAVAFVTGTLSAYALGQVGAAQSVLSHVTVQPEPGWEVRHGPVFLTDEYVYYETYEVASLNNEYDDIYGTAALCRARLDDGKTEVLLRSDTDREGARFSFFMDARADEDGNILVVKVCSDDFWESAGARGVKKSQLITLDQEGKVIRTLTLSDQSEFQGMLVEKCLPMDDGRLLLYGKRDLSDDEQNANKGTSHEGAITTDRLAVLDEQGDCTAAVDVQDLCYRGGAGVSYRNGKIYLNFVPEGNTNGETFFYPLDLENRTLGKAVSSEDAEKLFREDWPQNVFNNRLMSLDGESVDSGKLTWNDLITRAFSGRTLPDGTVALALFRYVPHVTKTAYGANLELYFLR